MKLQEHRAKLDQHKMYLMHIAAEADIVEQQEDSVRAPSPSTPMPPRQSGGPRRKSRATLACGFFLLTNGRQDGLC